MLTQRCPECRAKMDYQAALENGLQFLCPRGHGVWIRPYGGDPMLLPEPDDISVTPSVRMQRWRMWDYPPTQSYYNQAVLAWENLAPACQPVCGNAHLIFPSGRRLCEVRGTIVGCCTKFGRHTIRMDVQQGAVEEYPLGLTPSGCC